MPEGIPDLDLDLDDEDWDSITPDFGYNPQDVFDAIDIDGDGIADAFGYDEDGDGLNDIYGFDTDNDGVPDDYVIDITGDGNPDVVGTDTTGDGIPDNWEFTNMDDAIDTDSIPSFAYTGNFLEINRNVE